MGMGGQGCSSSLLWCSCAADVEAAPAATALSPSPVDAPPRCLSAVRCRRSYPSPWHDKPYLLHLGLQCYDRQFLRKYCAMPPTPLQVRAQGGAGSAGGCLLGRCFNWV